MTDVTVIIPAFNAEAHIGDALESVCGQTRRGAEVIVVDDGSEDATVQHSERFAEVLDLRIIRQANAGPAAARNVAVRQARGRYCAFLDADDVMLPDRLAQQIALLDQSPEAGFVHTDLVTFDERGVIHDTRWEFSEPCGGHILPRLLLDNFVTTSTVMAPVERLLEVGLFGEERRVAEDFELWLKMAARWPVGYIDQPLIRYRYRPGSLSGDKLQTGRAALEVVEAFWREHASYRQSHPGVYRESLARHLTIAGAAALVNGKRGEAFPYLLRALTKSPGSGVGWKWLVKTLLPTSLRSGVRLQRAERTAS